MSDNSPKKSKFDLDRHVRFIGGEGVIKSRKFEHGHWKYAIEMPQGKEPSFGRIGPETIVLLEEKELEAA